MINRSAMGCGAPPSRRDVPAVAQLQVQQDVGGLYVAERSIKCSKGVPHLLIECTSNGCLPDAVLCTLTLYCAEGMTTESNETKRHPPVKGSALLPWRAGSSATSVWPTVWLTALTLAAS